MNRLVVLVLIIAAVLPSATGAQMEPRGPITVVFPLGGTQVIDPEFTFVWDSLFAFSYHVKLQIVGGTRVAKLSMLDSECGSICALDFDPLAHDWMWRDGAQYEWKVKAKDEQGKVVAKSTKQAFTADMLPPIELNAPNDAQHITYGAGGSTHVFFTWAQDDYNFFRLLIWKKNGKVHFDIGWNVYHAGCDMNGLCSYPVLFNISKVGLKEYTWRVYAKRQSVSGKSKTAKRSLSITVTP